MKAHLFSKPHLFKLSRAQATHRDGRYLLQNFFALIIRIAQALCSDRDVVHLFAVTTQDMFMDGDATFQVFTTTYDDDALHGMPGIVFST